MEDNLSHNLFLFFEEYKFLRRFSEKITKFYQTYWK